MLIKGPTMEKPAMIKKVTFLFFIFMMAACSGSNNRPEPVPPSALFSSGFEKHSPTMGDPRAPIKVYVFSDFSCSECREATDQAKSLIIKNPRDVQVIFKHLPSQAINGSVNAAKAARAAALQNRFWDMHDVLFQFSRTRSKKEVHDLALILSLDLPQFKKDFDDEAQLDLIKKDASLARSWGINATPGFFVNGIPVPASGDLERAIETARRLRPSGGSSLSLR